MTPAARSAAPSRTEGPEGRFGSECPGHCPGAEHRRRADGAQPQTRLGMKLKVHLCRRRREDAVMNHTVRLTFKQVDG